MEDLIRLLQDEGLKVIVTEDDRLCIQDNVLYLGMMASDVPKLALLVGHLKVSRRSESPIHHVVICSYEGWKVLARSTLKKQMVHSVYLRSRLIPYSIPAMMILYGISLAARDMGEPLPLLEQKLSEFRLRPVALHELHLSLQFPEDVFRWSSFNRLISC